MNARDVTGIVLRYGSFYGLGTSLSSAGKILEMVCRRQLPLVGPGDWRQAIVPHIRLARTIVVWGCRAIHDDAIRGSSNAKAKRVLMAAGVR
jgi:hypothetical protein